MSDQANTQTSTSSNATSGFAAPCISLPSGGGSIRGMGDSFSMNNATGTGSYSIPVSVTSGRPEASTSLSLDYSTGGGSGSFGLGWTHSFELSVSRKTNPTLPRYLDDEESDTFILSGHGELVPAYELRESVYTAVITQTDEYTIKRYRPRLETHSRIELWIRRDDKEDTHWQVRSPSNELMIFGNSKESRIFAQDGSSTRVFSWLLSEQYNSKGHARQLVYKAEDSSSIDVDRACEKHRTDDVRSRMRYLKKIRYGNRKPTSTTNRKSTSTTNADYMFEIVFDYGEHDSINPTTTEVRPWKVRSDAYSTYRSGFEIRSYRICQRILMFHHIPEELQLDDYLVSATVLGYDDHSAASHLTSVQSFGYLAKKPGSDKSQYWSQSLPPLQLEYTEALTLQQLIEAPVKTLTDPDSIANLPAGVSGSTTWVDLFGEGIPGVLASQGGEWYYKQNISPVTQSELRLSPLMGMISRPSQQQEVNLIDVGSNGTLDLVCQNDITQGFYRTIPTDGDTVEWANYQSFRQVVNIEQSTFIRHIDLTGDGLADMLVFAGGQLVWYQSLGEEGYGPAKSLNIESSTSVLFSNDAESMHLADMSGDGLTDLVCVRNGSVLYWPNLGNGSFGQPVTMDGSPLFDDDTTFSAKKLLLCDIDGSGTTDIVYNRNGEITIHLNSSGNSFDAPISLSARIPHTQAHNVTALDILGNGTACIVWSADLPSLSLQYIDLTNGIKPHLLSKVTNNMGSLIEMSYAPSTFYYTQDKLNNRPWITKLPFPVHCVDSVTKHDLITGRKLVQRFAYHHGTYDHDEREFAGFAMVDQWDTERSNASTDHSSAENWSNGLDSLPVHHKRWYHTGVFANHDVLSRQLAKEYFSIDGTDVYESLLNDKIIYTAGEILIEEARQATYALRGTVLREELCSDMSNTKGIPYHVVDYGNNIEILQPCFKSGIRAIIQKTDRESMKTTLEQSTNARMSHNIILERDRYGRSCKEARVYYGRSDTDKELASQDQELQSRTSITYTENSFTNAIDIPGSTYHLPMPVSIKNYSIDTSNRKHRFEQQDVLDLSAGKVLDMQTEIRYRKDDLTGISSVLEPLALPGAIYNLCLTKDMLQKFQPAGLQPNDISHQALLAEGGYVDLKNDGSLWTEQKAACYHTKAVSAMQELEAAQSSFFSKCRSIDSFGNVTITTYDPYFIGPTKVSDACGDYTTATLNYRVLQIDSMTDINHNKRSIMFDALGSVVALAVSSSTGEGDSFDNFTTETSSDEVDAFFKDPLAHGTRLLGKASMRFMHDPWSFSRLGKSAPVRSAQVKREQHSTESPILIQVDYSSGFGQPLQTKLLAESTPEEPSKTRWRCTAWHMFNNKGLLVEEHEPFFDSSPSFVSSHKEGISTLHLYDALDREVITILPNKSWQKQVYSTWSKQDWDASDTVNMPLESDSYAMTFASGLEQSQYKPSWYEVRMALSTDNQDRKAAMKSSAYGCTPTIAYLDAKSRTFLTRKMLKEQSLTHRVIFDMKDQPLEIHDAGDRIVSIHTYDMQGRQMHHQSIDSGDTWTLLTTDGQPLQQYNGRGYRLRSAYDLLRRNTSTFCRNLQSSEPEYMLTKTIYGTDAASNAKGHVVQHFDQSGLTSTPFWDFKGNCLSKEVQLAQEYSQNLDWQKPNKLDNTKLVSAYRYDALNRLTSTITPDETVIKTVYLRGGCIGSILVNIRSQRDNGGWKWVKFASEKQYDAQQRLVSELQGNGMQLSIEYDKATQQIIRRSVKSKKLLLQDITYTRDINNDIVYTKRTSQLPSITRLSGNADSDYEYDSLRRLIKASGREDISQTKGRPDVPGNDPLSLEQGGMQQYNEAYSYDIYNNMTSIEHKIDSSRCPGWTRKMSYAMQPMKDKSFASNRLIESSVGRITERYTYDESGNIISMPHLSKVQWDVFDQMRSSSTQLTTTGTPETTWYVYNSSGERVRKVTERYRRSGEPARKSSEHIYLNDYDVYREYSGREDIIKTCESVRVIDTNDPLAIIEHWSDRRQPLIRYQIKDDHESISLELDEDGQEISYEEYSAYGSTTYSRSIQNIPKPYRYAIKRRDKETGLYFYGARYYIPWLCRWMSPDPSGLVDGTNTYIYCACSPSTYTDPDGNMMRGVLKGATTSNPLNRSAGPTVSRTGRSSRNNLFLFRSKSDDGGGSSNGKKSDGAQQFRRQESYDGGSGNSGKQEFVLKGGKNPADRQMQMKFDMELKPSSSLLSKFPEAGKLAALAYHESGKDMDDVVQAGIDTMNAIPGMPDIKVPGADAMKGVFEMIKTIAQDPVVQATLWDVAQVVILKKVPINAKLAAKMRDVLRKFKLPAKLEEQASKHMDQLAEKLTEKAFDTVRDLFGIKSVDDAIDDKITEILTATGKPGRTSQQAPTAKTPPARVSTGPIL